jgi:biopolymer transport protein ExbB/TolQ
MMAYQSGLIDRTEVLKKTDIFDKEGVMQRIDLVQQLQQQVEQQTKVIKELEGDLQTARREAVSARQRTEVEKFKGTMQEEKNKEKERTLKSLSKLETAVNLASEKSRMELQSGLTQENEVEELQ